MYLLLSRAVIEAIDAGALAAHTVLPPERQLAAALSVSRSTVVAAYDRLKEDGWLASRQGSGTWVRPRSDQPADTDAVTPQGLFGFGPTAGPSHRDPIEFVVAAPAGLVLVADAIRAVSVSGLAPMLRHHGYVPAGIPELRTAVALWFEERGVPTVPEQLVVCAGVQQGLTLIARQLLQPGDAVLVETPTFPGALDAYRAVGARLIPVPVDQDGMRVDVLADLLHRTPARLVHVAPTFHNPTGVALADDRRHQLVTLARQTGTTLVEDLALADLALADEPAPPLLAAVDSQAPVVSVGSMTKLFWAGLRTGWIRASESLVARLLRTKTVSDLGSPVFEQLVSARLLPLTEQAARLRRLELRPRLETLTALIGELLPDWTWTRPRGGVALWVTLPEGSAEAFADVAAAHGVSFVAGPSLSVDEGNRRSLRLVFAADEDTIERGIRRLSAAWLDYVREGRARPSRRPLV